MAEEVVSSALITKSFYFMLNMFLALFQPHSGAVDRLRTFKGEEGSGQLCV